MTALAARDDRDPVDRQRDAWQADARLAACAAAPTELLVAILAAPLWTVDALRAIEIDLDLMTGVAAPLVRRQGSGKNAVFTLEDGAVGPIDAELERRGWLLAASHVSDMVVRLSGAKLPPVLAAWRTLASAAGTNTTISFTPIVDLEKIDAPSVLLTAEVRTACEAGTPGDVLDLVEAARALARMLGGALAVAVRLAHHRIEYAYRVARDRRQLTAFVPRPEAMAAFDRLLADGPWALHYLGVGGVGKTTFLRHLAIDLAPARGLTVARIDFDYLSPTYPGRDPAMLVEAIVHELTVRIERADQDRMLRSIDEQVARVRAVARDVRTDDPIGPIAWPEFQDLLSFVGSLLDSFGKPFLVFDTCEELMKLMPVAGKVPSVEATFRLIEELHDRCPALRVIFAGRRPLAVGGADWSAQAQPVTRGLSVRRDYLALHELRGFRDRDARAVLALILPESRRADGPLIAAILSASPEDERVSGLDATDDDDEKRYSPFRVAMLGNWIASEPDLPTARLAGGDIDPYIEQRIVQRMGSLAPLLPYVALLRRFDVATLATVIGRPHDEVAALAEELAGHEWLDTDDLPDRGVVPGEPGLVVTARRSIAIPLERYLSTDTRASSWSDARRRTAAALGPLLAAPDAVRRPPELIDAALRALGGDAAVHAWLDLEQHIGDDWASALNLTHFLQGDRAAGEDPDTLLGAAIRATHASALIHQQPETDVESVWQEVEASAAIAAEGKTDDDTAAPPPRNERIPPAWFLLQRARLGLAATRCWFDTGDLDDQDTAIAEVVVAIARWRRFDALMCPVLAAFEAAIERAEREDDTVPELAQYLDIVSAPSGPIAFLAMLRARALVLAGKREASKETRLVAWKHGVGARHPLPSLTLDWLPPTNLASRISLEDLRLGFFDTDWADHDGQLVQPPPDDATDLDSQHLLSAIGLYAGAHRREPPGRLPLPLAPSPRRYRAHVRFPISAYAIALVRDGRMGPRDVIPLLSSVDAVRATFAWARPDGASREVGLAAVPGLLALELALTRALEDLDRDGATLLVPGSDHDLVDAWACQVANDSKAISTIVMLVRDRIGELVARASRGSLVARGRAAAMLEEVVELSRFTDEPIVASVPDVLGAIGDVHPDRVEEVVRLGLRAWAAGRLSYPPAGKKPSPIVTLMASVEKATPRRFAELAYEEARLLALRLPGRAPPLCAYAAGVLLPCDDDGSVRALVGAAVAHARAGTLIEVPAPLRERYPVVQHVLTGFDKTYVQPFERGVRRRPSRVKQVGEWWRRKRGDILGWALVVAIIAVVAVGGLIAFAFVTNHLSEWLGKWLGKTGSPGLAIVIVMGLVYFVSETLGARNAVLKNYSRRRRLAERLKATARIVRSGERTVVIELDNSYGERLVLATQVPRAGVHPALGTVGREPFMRRVEPLGGARAPIMLRVDTALAPHAWEAMLLANPILRASLDPIRRVPTPGKRSRRDATGELLASASLRAQIGAGLTGHGISHAIGRPVRGVASVGLDLGDERGVEPTAASAIAPPFMPLLILQGSPVAATEVPTDATRKEISVLRELATVVMQCNVLAVLVIPPTPVATMIKLIAKLRESIPERLADDALAAELAKITRKFLFDVDDAAHREAASEVTLFVATPD